MKLQRARATLSVDKQAAFTDIYTQNIDLEDTQKKKVDEYLCSVISSV